MTIYVVPNEQALMVAVGWLNANEHRIKNRPDLYPNGFDFPTYFDMPNAMVENLTSEDVDWLQEQTNGWIK